MSLALLFPWMWVGSSDTAAPITALVSESSTKISPVTGFDVTTVTWQVNEAAQAWMFRVVGATNAPYTAGSLIKQATGVSIPANTNQATTINESELVAASPGDGDKIVKLFAQDLAGNWSV